MASFEFTDRDFKARRLVLEIDNEFNIFSVAIRDRDGSNYMSAIIPLDDLREKGLFIKETVQVKETN